MQRRVLVVLGGLAPVIATLAPGCSVVTDFDGLTGGGADASPPDGLIGDAIGSLDAPEGGADGGADGVRDSAAADSPPESGAADARRDCSAMLFCADFDESNDLRIGWSGTDVNGGGSIALETQTFRTPPHAFASMMAAGSGYNAAALENYFGFHPTEEHLDHYVFLDKLDVSSDQVSLWVMGVVGPGGTFSLVRANARNGKASLDEEYIDSTGTQQLAGHEKAFTWQLKQWLHVHADVNTSTRTAALIIDGTPVVQISLAGPWTGSIPELKVGIYYSRGQATGQRLIFDDIAFDAK